MHFCARTAVFGQECQEHEDCYPYVCQKQNEQEPPPYTVHSEDVDDRGFVLVTTASGKRWRVPTKPLPDSDETAPASSCRGCTGTCCTGVGSDPCVCPEPSP